MRPDEVIDLTRAYLPAFAKGEFEVEAMEKGGSGRRFYRVHSEDGRSVVMIKYGPDRPENVRYAEIGIFLDRCGVRVPHVFHHDSGKGLMWIEDLGNDDLWAHRNKPWELRRPLYRAALREVHRIHTDATQIFRDAPLALEFEFDEALYLWEQRYFFEHCLGNVFKFSPADIRQWADLARFGEIARELASLPRVLVHRDFQSQNVMLIDGGVGLIDFQGMRPGLAAYDVASLLYDPYVDLTESEREELIGDYLSFGPAPPDFEHVYFLCALQRLMQALGAYGFLGLTRSKPEFLSHIPAAAGNLQLVLARVDGLSEFAEMLRMLPGLA